MLFPDAAEKFFSPYWDCPPVREGGLLNGMPKENIDEMAVSLELIRSCPG
jgi:hypothetical protein